MTAIIATKKKNQMTKADLRAMVESLDGFRAWMKLLSDIENAPTDQEARRIYAAALYPFSQREQDRWTS